MRRYRDEITHMDDNIKLVYFTFDSSVYYDFERCCGEDFLLFVSVNIKLNNDLFCLHLI